MHHNFHIKITPSQGISFHPFLYFYWLQFNFPFVGEDIQMKYARSKYEEFGGCNKKQQMAKE